MWRKNRMNLLDELRKTGTGLNLLADWLGEGGYTVPEPRAARRGATCLDNCCVENREPGWWDRCQNAIALIIRHQLELKKKLDLELPREDTLHMCRACGCCLKLKVWVPLDHIRRHTDIKQLAHYPEYCWIRRELLNQRIP